MDKKLPVYFHFLNNEEFAALSVDDRILYLAQAVEAIKNGAALDGLPIRDCPE